MRFLPAFALLGIAFVSANDDSYYELGFQEYNSGKWDAGFNARPEAVHGAGMGERVKPKIGAAEHGLNREPVNHGHPGIEPKIGPAVDAKQRHQDHVQQADSHAQQNHPAQQGKAAPKPAAVSEHKSNNAAGKKQQAAKTKPASGPAHHGNAQAKPAAQNHPAANANGNHAKVGTAAKGQAGHAKGAAAGQQKGAAAHAKPAAAAKQPAQQAKQAQVQGLQFNAGAQHRVAQDAGQQASPMETPSPEPAVFGGAVQHFAVRPPADECIATVYSTVTLVPGTTTM